MFELFIKQLNFMAILTIIILLIVKKMKRN